MFGSSNALVLCDNAALDVPKAKSLRARVCQFHSAPGAVAITYLVPRADACMVRGRVAHGLRIAGLYRHHYQSSITQYSRSIEDRR